MGSVAIILVNWNGIEDTRQCLDSLKQLDYSDFKVIVVDNASSDDSVSQMTADYQWIHLVQSSSNEGFTGGNNRGIKYALNEGFDYIMLLNNDTIVEQTLVSQLVETYRSQENIAMIQPGISFLDRPDLIWNAGGSWSKWWGISKTVGYKEPVKECKQGIYHVDWVTGCCVLMSREVVMHLGLLNDKYFAYYEDVDWSLRARTLGYSLLIDTSTWVLHKAGASGKAKTRRKDGFIHPILHYYNVRNHLWVIREHTKFLIRPTAYFYQVFKFLAYCGYFIIRGRLTKLSMTVRGFRDGLK